MEVAKAKVGLKIPKKDFGNIENSIEANLNNMQGQINMLDKRISKLENMVMTKDNYTNYNNSNYHIM